MDDPLLPPPHPLSRLRPSATVASISNARTLCRLLQPTQQHRMVDNTIPYPGNGRTVLERALLAVEDAETVSAVVTAAAPDGVTVDGEKLHDVPDGCPEHEKETWASKPFCGVTVTVAAPLWPEAMVNADGEMETVKLGGRLIVYAAVVTSLLE